MKKLPLIFFCFFLVNCFSILAGFGQSQLWGLTSSVSSVFRVEQDGSGYSSTPFGADPSLGFSPQGSLVLAPNGKLYGVATGGEVGQLGLNSVYLGVIFEFDPVTETYSKKWGFSAASGANPTGNLIVANGKLYGMTTEGGANEAGVIFEFDPANGNYVKKYDFEVATGSSPLANSMTLANNGKLYGMTNGGGQLGLGVIFEFDPITGIYSKKIDFDRFVNGAMPFGDLIQATDGKLYGMTFMGGDQDQGVLFEYDPSTNVLSKKIEFQASVNGAYPHGSLVQASNGKLYGRTGIGGNNNNGVLFEYNISDGSLIVKAQFEASTTGNEARGALVESPNGKLYGMNSNGGLNNGGVLYEYDLISGALTKKYDFNSSTGGEPRGSLIVVPKSNVKVNQTITFTPIPAKRFGDLPFNLLASSTSGLPITFSSSDNTIASINGSIVTILKAGSVSIEASQSGNSTFNPATPVAQILVIEKANQKITFNPLPSKRKGDNAFVLTASSTSGLPITYFSSNPKVATINGNVVTILKAGKTIITASQEGNDSYNPARSVKRTLQVNNKRGNDNDDCDDDSDDKDDKDERVSVFPNPSSGFITVRLGEADGMKRVFIFQLNGLLKAYREVYESETKFDISNYSNDIYLIKIVIGNKTETIRVEKR